MESDSEENNHQYIRVLADLAEYARASCGERTGFDCILIFLTWKQLGDLDPEFEDSLFLTTEERGARFSDRYSSQSARIALTNTILDLTLHGADAVSASLANNIIARMNESHAHEPPRPLLQAMAVDDGAAVALVVYDDLWIKNR